VLTRLSGTTYPRSAISLIQVSFYVVGDEKDFFEKLDEERAALDPRYAEMLRRDPICA